MINTIEKYKENLLNNELAKSSINKYVSDIEQLYLFLETKKEPLNKKGLIAYKSYLTEDLKRKPSTVNSKVISINKFLSFIGKEDLKLKNIRVQQKNDLDNVMSQSDYERLIRITQRKELDRDYMMIQAFYYSGLRVSELQYFTVESLKRGYMSVENKGKIRKVPIARQLEKIAKKYVKEQDIQSGSIIISNRGTPLSRSTVFKRLKYIAGQARVKKANIYPHSIRHLFAKNWLARNNNNVLQLADILGHDSVETTRIYTRLNTDEARDTINF